MVTLEQHRDMEFRLKFYQTYHPYHDLARAYKLAMHKGVFFRLELFDWTIGPTAKPINNIVAGLEGFSQKADQYIYSSRSLDNAMHILDYL